MSARPAPTNRPVHTQCRAGALTAADTAAVTGREPSAFITTIAHRPSDAVQVNRWVPGPDAEADQNGCWPGGVPGAPPGSDCHCTGRPGPASDNRLRATSPR